MARTPIPEVDSSAATVVGPLRDSFLRHLAAENRSPSTRVTYAAAIDLLAAFTAASGMPDLTELRREHIEAFLVDLGQRGQRPATLGQSLPLAPAVLQVAGRGRRDQGVADGQHAAAARPRGTARGAAPRKSASPARHLRRD